MRPLRTKGIAPALAAVLLSLPFLASCMEAGAREPPAPRSATPCTLVSYMGPRFTVMELQVSEHGDTVRSNIKAAPAEGSMIPLGGGAYMPKGREILGIGGCR